MFLFSSAWHLISLYRFSVIVRYISQFIIAYLAIPISMYYRAFIHKYEAVACSKDSDGK